MSVVVVVAPHPDDETLGCGGTLLKHKVEGDEVHWLIMSTISVQAGFAPEKVKNRSQEIQSVVNAYDFDSYNQTHFISTELDTIAKNELISEVSTFFKEIKPNIIYIPYRNDVHSDHGVIFDAVISCVKPFRYPFVRKVRVYETLSETEFGLRPEDGGFKPNLWINISNFLEKKIEIMQLYQGEMGEHPFPRSVKSLEALAIIRGLQAGCQAAEAFISLKEIIV